MSEIALLMQAVSTLKSATDLAKAAVGVRDAAKLADTIREMGAEIMSAQASALAAYTDQLALTKRVDQAEAELARLKAWNIEKAAYQLKEVAPGAFAYASQPTGNAVEPEHHLCPNCYNRQRKSILQAEGRYPGRARVLICGERDCGAEIYIEGARNAEHRRR